jgi:hypothetical protein
MKADRSANPIWSLTQEICVVFVRENQLSLAKSALH